MNTRLYDYTDYREYLKAYFQERKRTDSKFSHRYLSRRLGLTSPNFIMLVMQGKRNLTRPLAFRISQEFKLASRESEYFESMVGFAQGKTLQEKDRYFTRMVDLRRKTTGAMLEQSQYEYYSKWYNLVVRELVVQPAFGNDYSLLAKAIRPPVSMAQARQSVALLLRLGLIKKVGKIFRQCTAVVETTPQVSSLAVAKFHRTMAEHAIDAVDTVPRNERNMTACTVSVSARGFHDIVEAIADCRQRIMEIAQADAAPERVYQVNFHAYPVSADSKARQPKE